MMLAISWHNSRWPCTIWQAYFLESNLETAASPKPGLSTHHSDNLPSVRFLKQKGINECTFKLDDASYLVLEVVPTPKVSWSQSRVAWETIQSPGNCLIFRMLHVFGSRHRITLCYAMICLNHLHVINKILFKKHKLLWKTVLVSGQVLVSSD